MQPTELTVTGPEFPLRRWLGLYAAYLVLLIIPTVILLRQLHVCWADLLAPQSLPTDPPHQALKLLVFAIYISIACTFLPLPANWLVAAIATRDVALSPHLWVTVLVVATVGAVASTMANLNDYFIFRWLLRHRRAEGIRRNRLYGRAEGWFNRRPFWLLVVFNVLPIPVDVARILAAGAAYPLRPFIAANLAGRWVRYAIIAAITFEMGERGWIAPVVLLGAAVVMGIIKVGASAVRKLAGL